MEGWMNKTGLVIIVAINTYLRRYKDKQKTNTTKGKLKSWEVAK